MPTFAPVAKTKMQDDVTALNTAVSGLRDSYVTKQAAVDAAVADLATKITARDTAAAALNAGAQVLVDDANSYVVTYTPGVP